MRRFVSKVVILRLEKQREIEVMIGHKEAEKVR